MKKTLRKIRLALGKWLLDRKQTASSSLPTPIKKILFLRHDGKIGDYIVSSFVFRELKKQDPNLHIGVVCSTKTHYLFEKNPYIDQLYPVRTKAIFDYSRTARTIRQTGYDVLIDPTTLMRNRDLLFVKLINAKINIGYQKTNYQLFDLNITDTQLHFSQIYQKALAMIGYHGINTDYDLPFDEISQHAIHHFLTQQNLTKFIAINFFGASSSRNFSDENILAFLTYLSQHSSLPLVILTFPAVTDKLTAMITSLPNVFIFKETKTIFHTIEIIRQAEMVISPDTAIIHIASGLKKPLIAFYNNDQENFTHWHPNTVAPLHLLRYEKSVNEIRPTQLQPDWFKTK